MESGLFSVLPWLTMAVAANVGGWIADTLVSKGVSVTTVRKVLFVVWLDIHVIFIHTGQNGTLKGWACLFIQTFNRGKKGGIIFMKNQLKKGICEGNM